MTGQLPTWWLREFGEGPPDDELTFIPTGRGRRDESGPTRPHSDPLPEFDTVFRKRT